MTMMHARMTPKKKLFLTRCYCSFWIAPSSTAFRPVIGGRRRRRWFFLPQEQRCDDSWNNGCNTRRFLSATTTPTTSGSPAVKSQKPLATNATELQMLSFYHFEPLPDPRACRDSLFESLQEIPGLRGTIYLASEGMNAQMAVPPEDLDTLLQVILTDMLFLDPFENNPPNLGDVVPIDTPTFDRLIVRIRDFVLRDGIPSDIEELDWSDDHPGPKLSPQEWYDEIVASSGNTATLLDCRNGYESDQGTFQGAIPLNTDTFQQSWDKIDQLTEELPRDEPLMIFCTGGIRCVKVGAYLKQHLGFSNVKRLQHGIIGYHQHWLDQEGNNDSVWEGENFLFDKRRFEEKEEEPTNYQLLVAE